MEGGFLCRAVRYGIEGRPLNIGICHCITCRPDASAPRLSLSGASSTTFSFITGMPIDYSSSPGVTRSLCGRCGSPLTYRQGNNPSKLEVITVSLDNADAIPPTFHVWVSEAVAWDHWADDLPTYSRSCHG